MKSLTYLIVFLLVSTFSFGQNVELIEEGTKQSYNDRSYIYTKGVRINPVAGQSFRVNAAEHGVFFIKPAEAIKQQQNIPPSLDQNFVRTETILVSGISDEAAVSALTVSQKNKAFQYVDGLGRPLQSVLVAGSPTQKDIVTPFVYNAQGQVQFEYLPFTGTTNNGVFQSSQQDGTTNFYNSPPLGVSPDSRPFKENIYEQSPLNRVTEVFAQGSDWKKEGIAKGVKSFTKLNQESENIIHWNHFTKSKLEKKGIYPDNHLTVQETIDEEGLITKVYRNLRGLVILNRVGDGTNWFDTYYIYYPVGLVAIVIQPEGVERLATEFDTVDAAAKESFMNRWCFQYRYDAQQRLIAKRTPGWNDNYWSYTVFDKWNRIVMTQTPAQRENANQWTFNKYDPFNRVIISGLINYSATTNSDNDRQIIQDAVNTLYASSVSNVYETGVDNSIGYTLGNTFPQNPSESSLIQINYYDSYQFKGYTNWDLEGTSANYDYVNLTGFPQRSVNANSSSVLHGAKGYLTGSKVRILGDTRWLNSITYYDTKYRAVQVIAENMVGGKDRVTTDFDFVGKVRKTQLYHTSSSASLTTLREFDYDHGGRLLNLYQTTNGGIKTLMASNKYNEIGQLIEKNVHSVDGGSTFLQSVDYRYNIRGWLTSINNSSLSNDGSLNNDPNDLFGMELMYNPINSPVVNNYQTPKLYNGNISAIKWKTDTRLSVPEERIYGFDYDVLKRLEKAHYASNNNGSWTGNAGMFDEQITSYDKNGNIDGIVRSGKVNGAKTTIDNLTHNYLLNGKESNRLIGVSDATTSTLGFNDGATATEEFVYDASGNLIYDNNKKISSITYNHLNLPSVIQFSKDGTIDRIEYTYNAAGTKLRTVVKINGTPVVKTDYAGDIQYDNDQLTFASTPEGRIVKNGDAYDYEYFHKDHQGNVRLTYGLLKETVSYRATMEAPPAPSTLAQDEQNTFRNISSTTRYADVTPGVKFNFTKASNDIPSPDKSFLTNGFGGNIIGPAKSLRLLSGDKVRMEVMAKYNQVSGSSTPVAANLLIAALATSTFGFNPGETGHASFSNNANVIPGVGGGSSTLPKAYLAYLFFNDSYQFIPNNSGAVSISTSAYNAFEKLERIFTANQSGYLYVYVANESDRNVHFDEMLLVHQKNSTAPQVTQASDYYPFGLSFNTYQADRIGEDHKSLHKNRYGFQGQELQKDLDLGWSQFKWRMHDPAIGRFGGVDPLSDKYLHNSTYAFSENKVIGHIELEGLESLPFGLHWSQYGPAALITYQVDYLHDKIVGGTKRMAEGAGEYMGNEAKNDRYQKSGNPEYIPEDVQERNYELQKLQAETKMAQSMVDQLAGYTAIQTDLMFGVLGTFESSLVRNVRHADDALAGSIRNVNRVGGTENCVNCVIATDAMLSGNPASALNSAPQLLSVLEKEFRGKFVHGLSLDKINSMVSNSGQRGIIFGNRGRNQVGHVFNVVNQNGTIRYLDGQTGMEAILTDFLDFSFLPTSF